MDKFEKKIGYEFKNKKLYKEALSHSSYTNEGKRTQNNERLEFLGDSVLSLVVSEKIFKDYKDMPEGDLSKIRAGLVCEKSLCDFARSVNLGEHMFLGKGEERTGGRDRPSILADAFEALIAGIYLDGGLEKVRIFILNFIPNDIDINSFNSLEDYKTALQEIIQQNKEEKVEYILICETGPDHDKIFNVEVLLNSNVIGNGKGKSKKQAEQDAAKQALSLMGYDTIN
ncbi:MAG: ribonuclease III [Oscillospiraceae bacterium]|nr:ribonuclease III [Oscillospiraceae bacterium]